MTIGQGVYFSLKRYMMGKYRISLVILSFAMMYMDAYVNKVTSSYFVASTIFFAMLLYDYEKLKRNITNKLDSFLANIGVSVYCFLTFVYFFCTIASFNNLIKFLPSSSGWIFDLDIQFLTLPPVDFGKLFTFLFFLVLSVTLTELFVDREQSVEIKQPSVAEKG